MTDDTLTLDQLCLVYRLGLQRCQQDLAHLHALVHAICLKDKEVFASAAIAGLIANLEKELQRGHAWLDCLLPA